MKNKTYAAYNGGMEAKWAFKIRATEETPSERREAVLQLIEQFFNAFDGFLRPLRSECVVGEVDTDVDANAFASRELSNSRSYGIEFSSKDPYQEVWNAIGLDKNSTKRTIWITRFSIDQAAVKISLADGDYWLDADSDQYRRGSDDYIDNESPKQPPLRMSLFHTAPSPSSEHQYYIKVRTYTDIWFENTRIGQANRKRLVNAFSKFMKFSDKKIMVSSEFVPPPYDDEILNAIAEQLINCIFLYIPIKVAGADSAVGEVTFTTGSLNTTTGGPAPTLKSQASDVYDKFDLDDLYNYDYKTAQEIE